MASIRTYLTAKRQKRWEVPWREGSGKDRSKVFGREGDAKRFRVEVERRQQLGSLYDARRVTLVEFFDGWRDRYAQQVRPSSFDRKIQATPHLRPFLGLYLDQIRAAEVEDVITGVAKRAPRQAQLALAALKQILRNAQERGHVVDDAVLRIKPPRVEEREPRFLTWSEVEELAAACAEEQAGHRCVSHRAAPGGAVRPARTRGRLGCGRGHRQPVAARRGVAAQTKTRQSVRRAYLSDTGKARPARAVRRAQAESCRAGVPESDRRNLAAEQLHGPCVSAGGSSGGACRADVPRPSAYVCVAADRGWCESA